MDRAEKPILIAVRKVCERYGGVSVMWINRRLAGDPTFPRPVFINRLRFWRLVDLENWERTLATANPFPPPPAAGGAKKASAASSEANTGG